MLWSRYDRNKGFALPMTLILLTFGAFVLFAASTQLNRTSQKMKNYKTSSSLQNYATNAVDTASHIFLENIGTYDLVPWDGVEEFKSHILTRGGVEKYYWQSFLADIDSSVDCANLTEAIRALSADPGLGGDEYTLEAYVYQVGGRYTIVASAQIGDRKAYALGLISYVRGGLMIPAIRMAAMNRTLALMNVTGGHGNPKVHGDLVYGSAVVLNGLTIDMTSTSTPSDIISGGVTGDSLTVYEDGDELDQEDVNELLESFPGWYTASDPNISSDDVYKQWKAEYMELLPDASYTVVLSEDQTLSTMDENVMVVVEAPNSVSNPQFQASFSDEGLEVCLGKNCLDIPESLTSSATLSIQIAGDTVFGNDPHKISEVVGHYNVSVLGDATINTNIVLDYQYDYVNNGSRNSPVGNKTKKVSETIISNMLGEERTSSLMLATIGGDMILRFEKGNSTHGNKSLIGSFFSWNDKGKGGDVLFSGLENLDHGNGHTPQLFLFGSLTAYSFDPDGDADNLDSFVAVADSSDSSSLGTGNGRLTLIGIQTW